MSVTIPVNWIAVSDRIGMAFGVSLRSNAVNAPVTR
jgi:hypothetical protein